MCSRKLWKRWSNNPEHSLKWKYDYWKWLKTVWQREKLLICHNVFKCHLLEMRLIMRKDCKCFNSYDCFLCIFVHVCMEIFSIQNAIFQIPLPIMTTIMISKQSANPSGHSDTYHELMVSLDVTMGTVHDWLSVCFVTQFPWSWLVILFVLSHILEVLSSGTCTN